MAAIFEPSSRAQQPHRALAGKFSSRSDPALECLNGPDDVRGSEEGEEEDRSKRARILTNKLACSRCRKLKAKVVPREPPNGKCSRCTRLSFECLWVESQKRGRKTNDERYAHHHRPVRILLCADNFSFSFLFFFLSFSRQASQPAEAEREPDGGRTPIISQHGERAHAYPCTSHHYSSTSECTYSTQTTHWSSWPCWHLLLICPATRHPL